MSEESNQTSTKKRRIQADRQDDSSPINNNPSTMDVIPETQDQDESIDFMELHTTDTNNKLLESYRINESKAVKVEHHIQFLKQSRKEYKIPKGLQINNQYHVIDENQDFRAHINEIRYNAEMEIVNAILEHYETLYNTLCKKSRALTKKLAELTNDTPDLTNKKEKIDKPIKELKTKLQDKRKKKITTLETHTKWAEDYVTKKQEPERRLNYRERSNNGQIRQQQPRQQSLHSPREYRPPPNYQHRDPTTKKTTLSNSKNCRPQYNARQRLHNTTNHSDSTNMITQMLLFYRQQPSQTRNYPY